VQISNGSTENTNNVAEVKNVQPVGKKANTVLIFDSSGSMAEKIGGKAKIDIAKASTENFVNELDKDENNYLSVVVYGHKGSSSQRDKAISCAGIDEVYWMDVIKPSIISAKISPLTANGWTPIADSLIKAGGILNKNKTEGAASSIILVSDGEETCGGNPVKIAEELCKANIKVVTNVIGFNVSGSSETQLKAIANAGCGKYYPANNQEEMDNALVQVSGDVQLNMNNGGIYLNDGEGTVLDMGENGINLKSDGTKLNMGEKGIKLDDGDGTKLDMGENGINLKSDGTKLNMGKKGIKLDDGDGTKLDMGEKGINLRSLGL